MNILANRNSYSKGAFLLIILGDIFALGSIRFGWSTWFPCIIVLLLFLLWAIGWLNDFKFGFKSLGLSKMLANAITGVRWLSVGYLAAFIIHVGWLGNVFDDLYSSSSFEEAIFSFAVCLFVIFFLILFFPDWHSQKDGNATKVFISGISEIKVPYDKNPKKLNLRALVRILQNEASLKDCELLILRSDYNGLKDTELSKNIHDVLKFVTVNTDDGVSSMLAGKSILQQMEVLIKEVARKEYPERKDIDDLVVKWTNKACDYNDFKSCYDALNENVSEIDDKNHRLTCYVSPGTSLVASVITLMAIDGDRELYYYSQDDSLGDVDRLKHIAKDGIPLKNLLSQALETLENTQ